MINAQKPSKELLFSYGTLQLKSVQLENFGRELVGYEDILLGYRLEQLEITDPKVLAISGEKYHPILQATGNSSDKVSGVIFEITAEELAQADAYEVEDYQRVKGQFESGRQAWIYAAKD